jgi:hypothetical protein
MRTENLDNRQGSPVPRQMKEKVVNKNSNKRDAQTTDDKSKPTEGEREALTGGHHRRRRRRHRLGITHGRRHQITMEWSKEKGTMRTTEEREKGVP